MGELKVFSGTANLPLAEEVCKYLQTPIGDIEVSRFSDGEIFVQINENVRGCDVFVIQSSAPPVSENLMELLIVIDALKRASAGRITAVMPYYGYARQDRKARPRVPITARLVADLIAAAGVDRLLTVDLHADQIQGFFNIPVDHLTAAPVLLGYLTQHLSRRGIEPEDLVVVSPDAGGVSRARMFAKRFRCSLAIIDKRRESKNVAKVMHLVGDVEGKHTLIVDDLVDTAGSVVEAVKALKIHGAEQVIVAATHPVLSGPAYERLHGSELGDLVVTNTIPLRTEQTCSKIHVVSIAPLLGEAIERIHTDTTVSVLFDSAERVLELLEGERSAKT
jgi:ribose-phosphate pyrophosphokinase